MIGLGRLLGAFHQRHPGIRLQLTQESSANLLASHVHEGLLDLAFTSARQGPPGLRFVPVFRSPMVLACRPDDPLAGAAAVTFGQLGDRELIGLPRSFGARMIIDEALGAAGLEGSIRLEVNDIGTLLDLVAENLGITIVPDVVARGRADLRRVVLSGGDWTWTVSVVCAAPAPVNPAARALWDMAQQAWPMSGDRSAASDHE
jgi:DNA-binding transcriptional LysR family regulator